MPASNRNATTGQSTPTNSGELANKAYVDSKTFSGPQGFTGATGVQGSSGSNGSTGTQGTAGATGTQGVQGIQGSAGAPGFRNKIRNGNFNFWDNGATSFTPTSPTYTATSWQLYVSGQGSERINVIESFTVPNSGIPQSINCNCTTSGTIGSGAYYVLSQYIEMPDMANCVGQTMTISFWVKSKLTGAKYVSFFQNITSHRYIGIYTINAADTWEYHSITFTDDNSIIGSQLDPTKYYEVDFVLDCGSGLVNNSQVGVWQNVNQHIAGTMPNNMTASTSNYMQFSQVQLELGSVASSYESPLYSAELQRLQRYIWLFKPASGGYYSTGLSYVSTNAVGTIQNPVPMRVAPTCTVTGGSGQFYVLNGSAAGVVTTALSVDVPGAIVNRWNATVASGLTAGQATLLLDHGSGSSSILFSAEF